MTVSVEARPARAKAMAVSTPHGHGRASRRGAGGWQGLAGQHTDTPTDWRPPRGLRGLAGLVQATQAPPVWRVPEGPEGQAAVPVGGGGAWPGFETTRRAKLAAWTARGRAAAHGRIEQPGPQDNTRRPEICRGKQAAPPQRAEGNPYSPRNALIAGISRTACTMPAR